MRFQKWLERRCGRRPSLRRGLGPTRCAATEFAGLYSDPLKRSKPKGVDTPLNKHKGYQSAVHSILKLIWTKLLSLILFCNLTVDDLKEESPSHSSDAFISSVCAKTHTGNPLCVVKHQQQLCFIFFFPKTCSKKRSISVLRLHFSQAAINRRQLMLCFCRHIIPGVISAWLSLHNPGWTPNISKRENTGSIYILCISALPVMLKSHHIAIRERESLSASQRAPVFDGGAHARPLPPPALTFHTPAFTWTFFPAGRVTSCSSQRKAAAKPHTLLSITRGFHQEKSCHGRCVCVTHAGGSSCAAAYPLVKTAPLHWTCSRNAVQQSVWLWLIQPKEVTPSSWWPSVPTHRQMGLDLSFKWSGCPTFCRFFFSACVFSDLFLCVFDL